MKNDELKMKSEVKNDENKLETDFDEKLNQALKK
jgi:hypothetical protein